MAGRARVAVLASGGGSNLQAIIDHAARLGDICAFDIIVVASNRAGAGALDRARLAGVTTEVIASPALPSGVTLDDILRRHRADLVVLAGYMQLVPSHITSQFRGRMLNVHPGPLPSFGGTGMYGVRVHRAVLESGATESAATVHFVDDRYDHGAVIAQSAVPVLPGDDAQTLAARVLVAEHELYPRVIQAVAAGDVMLREDDTVSVRLPALFDTPSTFRT